MANGGVMAHVGLNIVALAARRHAVCFVVLVGIHKLCPLYPNNPEIKLNELKSPSELLDFEEFSDRLDYGTGTEVAISHHVSTLRADYYPADDYDALQN